MTKSTMQWSGQDYHDNSSFQYNTFISLLNSFNFKGNENILDIGCGDGKITAEIAKRAPNGLVLGIDNSENMIKFARSEYQHQLNLNFYLRDAQLFNFKNSFDLVISSFCLHWVPDKEKAFQVIYDTLKKDGVAILIMPKRNKITSDIRKNLALQNEWKHFFVDYVDPSDTVDDNAYDYYAKISGLLIKSYIAEEVTQQFQSRAALQNFLTVITPHINRLPNDSDKKRFMDQLTEQYLEKVLLTQDCSCELTYVCVKLIATKE